MMLMAILAILLLLGLLIIAGPVLEAFLDRIWPPDGPRARRRTHSSVAGRPPRA